MVTRYLSILFVGIYAGTACAQGTTTEGARKINGTSLYIKTIGKGEPIIVVHGGPGMNYSYFLPHMEVLSKKHQLIFFDQRASGKSAIPPSDSISLSYFVNDIEAIRNELRLDQINLFAHSWGAILAVEYALDYPGHLKNLILCNPVPLSTDFNQEMATVQLKKITKQDSLDRAQIINSTEFKAGDSEAYRKLLLISFRHSFYKASNHNKLRYEMPGNYVQASRALFTGLGKDLGQYDYYEAIKACAIPVLIIHGAADVIPETAIQQMLESFPKATLVTFSYSGHFTFIEEPEKLRKEIVGFLSGKK